VGVVAQRAGGFARALLIGGWNNKTRILCAREVQKSIKDSVHRLLADQVDAMGLGSHYEVLRDSIRGANGTEFLFTGLSNLTAGLPSIAALDRIWPDSVRCRAIRPY